MTANVTTITVSIAVLPEKEKPKNLQEFCVKNAQTTQVIKNAKLRDTIPLLQTKRWQLVDQNYEFIFSKFSKEDELLSDKKNSPPIGTLVNSNTTWAEHEDAGVIFVIAPVPYLLENMPLIQLNALHPDFSGWIYKSSKHGDALFFSKEEKRYAVIKDNLLFYFKSSQGSKKPKGVLILDFMKDEGNSENSLTLIKTGPAWSKTKLGFQFRPCPNPQLPVEPSKEDLAREMKRWSSLYQRVRCTEKQFGVELSALWTKYDGPPPILYDVFRLLSEREVHRIEGIFRIPGSRTQIVKIQEVYDNGGSFDWKETDPHTVVGVLKEFLKQLPDPVIPFRFADKFFQLAAQFNISSDPKIVVPAFNELLSKIPYPHLSVLRKLLPLAARIVNNKAETQMTIENLSTCFASNILRRLDQSEDFILQNSASCVIFSLMTIHNGRLNLGQQSARRQTMAFNNVLKSTTTSSTKSNSNRSSLPPFSTPPTLNTSSGNTPVLKHHSTVTGISPLNNSGSLSQSSETSVHHETFSGPPSSNASSLSSSTASLSTSANDLPTGKPLGKSETDANTPVRRAPAKVEVPKKEIPATPVKRMSIPEMQPAPALDPLDVPPTKQLPKPPTKSAQPKKTLSSSEKIASSVEKLSSELPLPVEDDLPPPVDLALPPPMVSEAELPPPVENDQISFREKKLIGANQPINTPPTTLPPHAPTQENSKREKKSKKPKKEEDWKAKYLKTKQKLEDAERLLPLQQLQETLKKLKDTESELERAQGLLKKYELKYGPWEDQSVVHSASASNSSDSSDSSSENE